MKRAYLSNIQLVYRWYALTIFLIPLNSILGTTLLWGSFVSIFASRQVRNLSFMEYILVGLIFSFLFSLFMNIAEYGFSERVIAALYNIALLCFSLTALHYGERMWLYNADNLAFFQIEKSGFFLWIASSTFVAGAAIYARIFGTQELSVSTLLFGFMHDLPGILKFYSTFPILGVDWVSEGAKPRPVGFGVYYTEGALTLALSAILAKRYVQRIRFRFPLLVDGMSIILLNEMGSRTLLLAYILGFILSIGLSFQIIVRNSVLLVMMITTVLLPLLLLGGMGYVESLFQDSLSMRQGSTDLRFESYTMAIDMVLNHNVIYGLGVKPVDPALPEIPVGSHSTFVSFFTKGGAISEFLLAVFYVSLISKWAWAIVRLGEGISNVEDANWQIFKSMFRAAFIFMFWIWTEDMDATFNAPFLTFFLLGLGNGQINLMYRGILRGSRHSRLNRRSIVNSETSSNGLNHQKDALVNLNGTAA